MAGVGTGSKDASCYMYVHLWAVCGAQGVTCCAARLLSRLLKLSDCDGLRHATLSSPSLECLLLSHCQQLARVDLSCPSLSRLGLEECTVLEQVALATQRMTVSLPANTCAPAPVPPLLSVLVWTGWTQGTCMCICLHESGLFGVVVPLVLGWRVRVPVCAHVSAHARCCVLCRGCPWAPAPAWIASPSGRPPCTPWISGGSPAEAARPGGAVESA